MSENLPRVGHQLCSRAASPASVTRRLRWAVPGDTGSDPPEEWSAPSRIAIARPRGRRPLPRRRRRRGLGHGRKGLRHSRHGPVPCPDARQQRAGAGSRARAVETTPGRGRATLTAGVVGTRADEVQGRQRVHRHVADKRRGHANSKHVWPGLIDHPGHEPGPRIPSGSPTRHHPGELYKPGQPLQDMM